MNEILTTGVLQTIIICISSLIALYCIASIIKNLWGKKDDRKICHLEKKNNCETCYEKKHLLYKLIVVFLVFLLVILFSHKFYAYDNIFNFMSFASAIISIILAVLTIIYSYYTNGTTSSSVEKLGNASKKIEGTLITVNEASQSYKESAESLKDNITLILQKLDQQIKDAHKVIADLASSNELNLDLSENAKPKFVKDFVETSSIVGVAAMYACVKSNETNTPFSLESLWKDNDYMRYSNGYLIAARSAGLLNISIASKKYIVTVKKCHPALEDNIQKYIKQNEKRIQPYIQKIDSYFKNI